MPGARASFARAGALPAAKAYVVGREGGRVQGEREQPSEEEAQRQSPKVEPDAGDLPKDEPDAGPQPERSDS